MEESLKSACGIVGVFGHPEAANMAYLALHALQHRGQESAGIAVSNGSEILFHKGLGLVQDVFDEETIRELKGDMAIGHVRYSTTGTSDIKNAQPFVVEFSKGPIAVAHNGNLVNAYEIRKELENDGSIFQSTMDTEVIVHLIAKSRARNIEECIFESLLRIKGAFSLVFLTKDMVIAARDSYGFRPLVLGRLKRAYVIASETCAFDLIDAEYIREIEPGEVLYITKDAVFSERLPSPPRRAFCIFEHVYFSRPDSIVFGMSAYSTRVNMGRILARESPVDADIVIPVPDSGMPAAIGYSRESGIPLEMGFIRSHYVGRTFIEPEESIRHFGVKLKLNAQKDVLKGKRVVVIDDSIVRGTTSRKIIKMVRDAGAKEVHVRISSPPIIGPCYYGIDTPTKKELIASSLSIDEIRKFILADSLYYLSLDGMVEATGMNKSDFCLACFTDKYPIEIPSAIDDSQLKFMFEQRYVREK